jgi:hypothetical protein
MKTVKSFIILLFLISTLANNLVAQDHNKSKSALELGIDFARFNRNWVYMPTLHPNNGHEYAFDFIPSIFVKLPKDRFSLRLKYEYLATNYSSHSMSFDASQALEGRLKEHRLLFGFERNLINKKISIYYLSDIGLSLSNFNGKYVQSNITNSPPTPEYFKIDQFTLFLQPGVGFKYKLSNRLAIKIESAVFIGKGFEKPNKGYILPNSRFTPRPISAFGLSYKFN